MMKFFETDYRVKVKQDISFMMERNRTFQNNFTELQAILKNNKITTWQYKAPLRDKTTMSESCSVDMKLETPGQNSL